MASRCFAIISAADYPSFVVTVSGMPATWPEYNHTIDRAVADWTGSGNHEAIKVPVSPSDVEKYKAFRKSDATMRELTGLAQLKHDGKLR
jgi:hypothetical protein